MIVNEDFLAKLKQSFKLNMYEAKTWTALLSRGASTAGELAEISDVPRSRTYDVLEGLEKKGFILMKVGKPIEYLAVKPADVVEKAKMVARNEAEDQVSRLEGLSGTEVLNELDLLYKQGIEMVDPREVAGSVKGRHNIYLHMDSIIRKAKSSVCIATSAKGLARKAKTLKPALEELKKKGVKIRIAVPVTKESSNAIKELAELAEIRHLQDMKARFCIVDDKEMMFMLTHDNDVHAIYDVGIWADTPFFASALGQMFNLAWEDMEDCDKAMKKL